MTTIIFLFVLLFSSICAEAQSITMMGPVSGGTISTASGGTGATNFTANLPILGNGTGPLTQGSRSGTTTTFVTTTGTLTSGHCVSIDGSGDMIDAGGACTTGGGGGTVSAGLTGNLGYYATNSTVISPLTLGSSVLTALGVNVGTAGSPLINGGVLGTPSSGTLTNTTGFPAVSLAGGTLASNVLASSLTSVGTLTGGATGSGFTIALASSTLTGTLPSANFTQASSSVIGGVQGDGSTLTISTGTISCTTATPTQIGCSKPGTGLSILAGTLTPTFGTATNQVVEGGVIVGAGPIGSATTTPILTYNSAGQLTTVTPTTITPAVTSLTGLGSGVASALAAAVNTPGSLITYDGALGVPTSATLTNATGLPTTALTGSLQAAQEPAHTGDVTNTAASLAMTVVAIGGNPISLGGPLTITGSGSTTLAFGSSGNTYIFPNSTDTITTNAATQTLTNKSISGSEINSGTVPSSSLPTATSSTPGIVQGDGSSTTLIAGVLSVTNPIPSGSWTAYTPTVSCATSGSITTDTVSGRYQKIAPKTVVAQININITTLGLCLGSLNVSTPGGITINSSGSIYVGNGYNSTSAVSTSFIASSSTGFQFPFSSAPAANNYYGTVTAEIN